MVTPVEIDRPNISRVYDYILGGHHNFEVDRMAAQQILKTVPSYPIWARLNRWFLQQVGQEWRGRGCAHILDLGSGMPTQDHFHAVLPEARVVYSDNDPITVTFAQEVLAGNPLTRYVEGDVRAVDGILAAANEHFLGERRAGIGCIGLAYLFDDETLRAMLGALHAWAAPGSTLAISFASASAAPEEVERALQPFRLLGMAPVIRTPEAFAALAAPWRVADLRPLHEWVGVEKQLDPSDALAATAEMYGALLER
jgi:hypothetical protein